MCTPELYDDWASTKNICKEIHGHSQILRATLDSLVSKGPFFSSSRKLLTDLYDELGLLQALLGENLRAQCNNVEEANQNRSTADLLQDIDVAADCDNLLISKPRQKNTIVTKKATKKKASRKNTLQDAEGTDEYIAGTSSHVDVSVDCDLQLPISKLLQLPISKLRRKNTIVTKVVNNSDVGLNTFTQTAEKDIQFDCNDDLVLTPENSIERNIEPLIQSKAVQIDASDELTDEEVKLALELTTITGVLKKNFCGRPKDEPVSFKKIIDECEAAEAADQMSLIFILFSLTEIEAIKFQQAKMYFDISVYQGSKFSSLIEHGGLKI